jgi:hypothetical protein
MRFRWFGVSLYIVSKAVKLRRRVETAAVKGVGRPAEKGRVETISFRRGDC